MLVSIPKQRSKKSLALARLPVVTVPRQSRRRQKRSQVSKGPRADSLTAAYAKTLEDPWEYGPVRLGFQCMVPTVLSTAYLRGTATVNADGSFALVAWPDLAALLQTNTAGATTSTWTTQTAQNQSAIAVQGTEGRIVSMGLRCFCLFPATSAPGALFAGTLTGQTVAQIQGYNPSTLAALSTADIGIGSQGARVVARPTDVECFMFKKEVISGYNFATISPTTQLFITGQSFPVNTRVFYEVIVNLELLPSVGSSAIGVNADEAPNPTLADKYPSAEMLMTAVRPLLGNASIMDGVAGLAQAGLSAIHPLAGAAFGFVRSAFGSGRTQRAALVAGSNASHQARESSVMIEEMKGSLPSSSTSSSSRGWLRV